MQTVTCFAQTGTNRQMRLWPTTVKAAAVRPSAHISPASMCWPAGGVHLSAASVFSAAAAQGPFYLPHGPHVFFRGMVWAFLPRSSRSENHAEQAGRAWYRSKALC